eukprot:1143044-Pelagomonas_calceolata.AAC.1
MHVCNPLPAQVTPPRIKEAAVQMECKLRQVVDVHDACMHDACEYCEWLLFECCSASCSCVSAHPRASLCACVCVCLMRECCTPSCKWQRGRRRNKKRKSEEYVQRRDEGRGEIA